MGNNSGYLKKPFWHCFKINQGIWVLWPLLFCASLAQGQACFTLDFNTGCAPLTVTATDCSGSVGSPWPLYDWGDGTTTSPSSSTATHTYLTSGNFTIRQFVPGSNTARTVNVRVSSPPSFTLAACEGNIVIVDIPNSGYDIYELDYGDGTIINTAAALGLSHTYPNGSARTLTLRGLYTGAPIPCGTATANFTPIAAIQAPDISHLIIDNQSTNGAMTLHFLAQPNQEYGLQLMEPTGPGIGTFNEVDIFSTTTAGYAEYTFPAAGASYTLDTENKQYCLRMEARDACAASIFSDIICSVNLSVANGNNQNTISWNNYDAGGLNRTTYTLQRDGVPLFPNASSPTTDLNVTCQTNYTYKLITTLSTTHSTGSAHYIESVNKPITAISTDIPLPGINLNSTFNSDNSISYAWEVPVGENYSDGIALENKNNLGFQTVGSSVPGINLLGQPDLSTLQSVCYTVEYANQCQNLSGNALPTCPPILRLSLNGTLANLTWTPYVGYSASGISSYEVEILDANFNVLRRESVGLATTFSEILEQDEPGVFYRVRVVAAGLENLDAFSNTEQIILSLAVSMPGIFSPNGDGENDALEWKGRFVDEIEWSIYNRWGEVVFQTEDTGLFWDGSTNGNPAPSAVYGYTLVVRSANGQEIKKSGEVTLVR
jgi:gliding motility-associated-like protein